MNILMKRIEQNDRKTFTITWSDGKMHSFTLDRLQHHCPCAGCQEKEKIVNREVSATRIVSVGRYALKVSFTSGCSAGIYDYSLLRKLGELLGDE